MRYSIDNFDNLVKETKTSDNDLDLVVKEKSKCDIGECVLKMRHSNTDATTACDEQCYFKSNKETKAIEEAVAHMGEHIRCIENGSR